jgi:hypothetical protein
MGYGLAYGLSEYGVMRRQGDNYEFLAHSDTGLGACGCLWYLRELVPAAGYIASLAMRSRQNTIRCWSWDPP